MKRLTYFILTMGLLLIAAQYLTNRPLWADEESIAYNIINRDVSGLLLPLDYNQAAPPGWLVLEKAVTTLAGVSTYSLRLLPLLAAAGSLLLLAMLMNRMRPSAAPLAVGLLATNTEFIRYSSEVKQYSTDVFIALALLLAALRTDRRGLMRLAVMGAAAVWFSHAAIFVLAGLGLALLLTSEDKRAVLAAGAVWLLSFGLVYLLVYRNAGNNALESYWAEWVFQLDIVWLIKALFHLLILLAGEYQLILMILFLAAIIIASGNVSRLLLMAGLLPIGFTLAGSGLAHYPFNGRLLLFLLPGLYMLIAIGLDQLLQAIARPRLLRAAVIIALVSLPLFTLRFDPPRSDAPQIDLGL